MLNKYTFKGKIVLEFTKRAKFSNREKIIVRTFDYVDVIYAKDVFSAQEKRYFVIDKRINAEYREPVNWNALAETKFRVQGCLGFDDVKRVTAVRFVEFKEISIYESDISDWTFSECKRNMTPQELKEHCEG